MRNGAAPRPLPGEHLERDPVVELHQVVFGSAPAGDRRSPDGHLPGNRGLK